MSLKKVIFDKKKFEVHFFFGSKHLSDQEEYIVDSNFIQGILDYLIDYEGTIARKRTENPKYKDRGKTKS